MDLGAARSNTIEKGKHYPKARKVNKKKHSSLEGPCQAKAGHEGCWVTLLPWTAGSDPRDQMLHGAGPPWGMSEAGRGTRWVEQAEQEMFPAPKNSLGGDRKQKLWATVEMLSELAGNQGWAVGAATTPQRRGHSPEPSPWRTWRKPELERVGGLLTGKALGSVLCFIS